jgi:hypothetical protein
MRLSAKQVLALLACLLGWSLSAAETSVAEAWDYMMQPHGPRGDNPGLTDGEVRAMNVLRANKAEVERRVVAAMRKGGGAVNLEAMAAMIFNRTDLLRIAREVVRTYEVGDKDIPFIGCLTYHGEKQDMKLLKEWIALDPDSDNAVEWTALMAASDNPHAHAALLELKNEVPGKWQKSDYSKRFFARQSITPSPGAKPEMPVKREATPPPEAPAQTAKKAPTDLEKPSRQDSPREWGLLAGVLAVAVVAVIVLLGLRARHRARDDKKPDKA